jgi:16S rRNA (guanine527-N7)-methyltransferase
VDRARIDQQLRPYAALSAEAIDRTSMYIDMLLRWNARMNLTAVRDLNDIVTRHFGESFFTATHLLEAGKPTQVVDVGSGAGFPGLPLAIYSSDAQVTLIEANTRKAAFLHEVIGALRLSNATIFSGRAEVFSETADVVTMRAVEKFEKSLLVAGELVKDGGRLGLLVGLSQLELAGRIASRFVWAEPIAVPGSHARVLSIGAKSAKVEQMAQDK